MREEEARAKGLALAQARAQTLALGHALADAEWKAWNERRLAAEAKGEPFDEPTPATLRNRDRWQAPPGQDDAPPCGGLRRPPRQAPHYGCGARRTPSIVDPTDQ